MEHSISKKLAAEFIGTFWHVLGGCGSAVLAATFPNTGIGFVGVSLAIGLTVLTGAYALGPISGGHFNPAVSVGLAVAGRFKPAQLPGYIIAQVLGAIAAAGVLYLIATGKPARMSAASLPMAMVHIRRVNTAWAPLYYAKSY